MVYEELKKAARGSLSTKIGSNGELGSAEISFMGAASKLVASIATYPSQARSQGLCNTLSGTKSGAKSNLRPSYMLPLGQSQQDQPASHAPAELPSAHLMRRLVWQAPTHIPHSAAGA